MQQWRREIILDTLLNGLLDPSYTGEHLLDRIMQQPHEEIVRVYTKLASLKHALTRSIQEEVEHRHDQIGHSFQKTYALKKKYEISDQDDLKDHLSHLEKFNKKYERVASNLPIWTNSTRILHFGKALEKFKVSIKLLRTLMKDCDESASQRQLHGIANTLKMSKIIKELTALCLKHDFTGLAAYDSQRNFIVHSRTLVYALVEKELLALLVRIPKSLKDVGRRLENEKDILAKVIVLNNLNNLREFAVTYYKSVVKETQDCLKKVFQGQSVSNTLQHDKDLDESIRFSLRNKILEASAILLTFQEVLLRASISLGMSNLFEKYWQKFVESLQNFLRWRLDQESKEIQREKGDNLYQAYASLAMKAQSARQFNSIVWKYPVLLHRLSEIANQVDLYILKSVCHHNYNFSQSKEQIILKLAPIAELYRQAVQKIIDPVVRELQREILSVVEASTQADYPSMLSSSNIPHFCDLLAWVSSAISSFELYFFVAKESLAVVDKLQSLRQTVNEAFNKEIHDQNRLNAWLVCVRSHFKSIKCAVLRREIESNYIMVDNQQELSWLMKKFQAQE